MTVQLTSPTFDDGGPIPERHAKDGDDVSPPLRWTGVPPGTAELALLVRDPDAPGGTFTHWIVANLDPGLEGLETGELPELAVEGLNDFGDVGYGGPQPPAGDPPHRYVFQLLALRRNSGLSHGASYQQFHDAVQGKQMARGELVGRYGR